MLQLHQKKETDLGRGSHWMNKETEKLMERSFVDYLEYREERILRTYP